MHMTETLQSMSDASSISGMSESSQLVNEPAKDDGKLRSNIPMTSFNMINSIIGSGVIGVPYALKRAGIGLGIVIILVAALASDYAILLLIDGGKLSGGSTYQIFLFLFAGCCSGFIWATRILHSDPTTISLSFYINGQLQCDCS